MRTGVWDVGGEWVESVWVVRLARGVGCVVSKGRKEIRVRLHYVRTGWNLKAWDGRGGR